MRQQPNRTAACGPRGPDGFRVLLCLLFGGACLIGCGSPPPPSTPEPTEQQQTADEARTAPETKPDEPPTFSDARTLLEAMVAAYQEASSYLDHGTVSLKFAQEDRQIDDSAPFSVALLRPGKLRAHIYQAVVVADGTQYRAFILDLPGQVLGRELAGKLTLDSVYPDPLLADAMTNGIAGAAPQLMLLLHEKPLDVLLDETEPEWLEPETIQGHECYRVRMRRASGNGVFWIDRRALVLRRIEFPVDQLRAALEEGTGKPAERLSLVAEFSEAQLDAEISAEAFQFELPADARLVKFFEPPHPGQLAGQTVPEFAFLDFDGRPVDNQTLRGKIAVLCFCETLAPPGRAELPQLKQLYEKYQDNDKIDMRLVSVDSPDAAKETIREALDGSGLQMPPVRDLQQQLQSTFRISMPPAVFVLDAEGIGQYFLVGANPDLAAELSTRLDKLLAGEDTYAEPKQAYEDYLKDYEKSLAALSSGEPDSPGHTVVAEHRLPQTEIAQRTEPTTLKLTPLWTCTELRSPGNILVVQPEDAPPRILVLEQYHSVAEIAADGKIAATHKLPIDPQQEAVANLRTAVDAGGKRYYAVLANLQQRFHLFDGDWNLQFHFPDDALQNKHAGIADVQLGDLNGDGQIEACVGYWGVVGAQGVSVRGERIWSYRAISNVLRLALGPPDAEQKQNVYCVNTNGTLVVLDAAGQRQGRVAFPGRLLGGIFAADLQGDGTFAYCGTASPQLGDNLVLGLNLKGEELWSYELPPGFRQQPIEPVVAGNVRAQGPGQWLLPGPDGSIHVVTADGQLVDKFNYGSDLAGLATARLDGQPLLIVAGRDGLRAWKIE